MRARTTRRSAADCSPKQHGLSRRILHEPKRSARRSARQTAPARHFELFQALWDAEAARDILYRRERGREVRIAAEAPTSPPASVCMDRAAARS